MQLIATDLSGSRGGETVFSGVSFRVAAGESLVVTGPNGSGKSTLLKIIAVLLPASAGKVSVEGGGDEPGVSAHCHYLGHENAMKPVLSIRENLEFWQILFGEPLRGIDEALEAVGLGGTGDLPFGTLSTGQRRRVAIARLLVSHRPIWLLDEPTAGLDARSERRFAGLMAEHVAGGGILVAATHVELGLAGAGNLALGNNHE